MKLNEHPIIIYLSIAVTAFVAGVGAILYTQKLVRDEVANVLRFVPSGVDKGKMQRIGDLQILWGTQQAVISKSSDYRKDINFDFTTPFAERPVVTIGISGNRGDAFWVMPNSHVTSNHYDCTIGAVNGIGNSQLEANSAKKTDVQIDYIAIGRWR